MLRQPLAVIARIPLLLVSTHSLLRDETHEHARKGLLANRIQALARESVTIGVRGGR